MPGEGGQEGGPRHHRGPHTVELVLCGRQGEEGGRGSLHLVGCGPAGRAVAADNQLEEVEACDGAELPTQLVQDLHFHAEQLVRGDGAVSVDDQFLDAQRLDLAELGGEEEAGGGYQLQLRLEDSLAAQHAVKVLHGQQENLKRKNTYWKV